MRPSTSPSSASLDLRSKFHEIPMARADILQASLRANPVFYQDGQLLQYRAAVQPGGPGGPQQFDTNITYPLDISHKRQARTVVAARAEKVLEASYPGRRPAADRRRLRRLRRRPERTPDGPIRRGRASRGWRTSRPDRAALQQGRGLRANYQACEDQLRTSGSAWSMPRPPTARPGSTWARS